MVFVLILGFLFTAALLNYCADHVVRITNSLSKSLHIKSFIIGFVLVGITTTFPEMFVAANAVTSGLPEITVGNLLGGIILLTGFVFGLGSIALGRITLNHGFTKFDILLSSIILASPVFVLWDGELTRLDGVLLVFLYCVQLVALGQREHVVTMVEEHVSMIKHPVHQALVFLFGVIGVAAASHIFIFICKTLAQMIDIPELVLGLFVVSIGTNLPEIFLTIDAVVKKQRNIAYGSILGSSVINPAVLGVIGVFSPFVVGDLGKLRITLIILFFAAAYFYWAASSKRDITRTEGVGLFLMYLLFICLELFPV